MKNSPATRLAVLAAALAAPALLAGCGSDEATSAGAGPRVVASFYPLAFVAQRVAGDRATVSSLTAPGVEPHELDLPIARTADVAEAELVVYERGFQPSVDDIVDAVDPEHVVDATEYAELLPLDGHEGEGEGNDHGEVDPHFWLDPIRLTAVAQAVHDELVTVDPDHATDYGANLAALEQDLTALDEEYTAGLSGCARTTVVVSHDAFGYLGARYGLDLHGVNGLSPEAEPSPAHLAELHELVEQKGITTVFSEELASPALAEALAGDLRLRTEVLDPIEGLSDATADQDYLSLMRSNLAALKAANACP